MYQCFLCGNIDCKSNIGWRNRNQAAVHGANSGTLNSGRPDRGVKRWEFSINGGASWSPIANINQFPPIYTKFNCVSTLQGSSSKWCFAVCLSLWQLLPSIQYRMLWQPGFKNKCSAAIHYHNCTKRKCSFNKLCMDKRDNIGTATEMVASGSGNISGSIN